MNNLAVIQPLCSFWGPKRWLSKTCWNSDSEEQLEEEEDGTFVAHCRLWVPLDSVMVDSASHFSSRGTTFLWPAYLQLGERSLVKYFYLLYPVGTLQETIRLTNVNLGMDSFRPIGPGDLFRWIGIRLAMAVEPRRGATRVYWNTQEKDGYVNTPANYAIRFQMSRHCFEQVMYALAFSDNSQTDDPWDPIRPWEKKHVSPGNILVVDECMSVCKGREAKYTHDDLPHKTKIARKPEGTGTEPKSLADGDSGALLGLERVEGAVRQHQKEHFSEFGEGTSVILRLVEQYKGTGRTVVADSAFASVKNLVQLKKKTRFVLHGHRKDRKCGVSESPF
ncbi:hypothetical protein JG687_00011831 [Phytophthora cactorum]|uniref:PiggyBac transposable element-derived protein domain-containing protein n=1 Tax=Phytophthora cactorum TaxID=29920 RepID=A0A8T1U798_9STRA|nr:hypothetical protein JG687_00011831 [Phytophthora cactorum]